MRIVPVLLATAVLAACNFSADARSERSGEDVRRDVAAEGFDTVTLSGPYDVVVSVGGAHSVRVEGDSGLIDDMEIRVEDAVLHIAQKKGVRGWDGDDDIRVYVTMPLLKVASVAGSGDISVDRVEGDAFGASIAGSGNIGIADMRVALANFGIAGSGDIQASGAADRVVASIAGSGDIEAGAVRARNAKVSVSGSGNVSVDASETAEVSLLGSGDAVVTGGARCTVNKHGSGELRCG